MPDKLEIRLHDFDYENPFLYGVIVGDINSNHGWGERYPFRTSATPPEGLVSSDLHQGYISCYVLTEQGELLLDRFEYPYQDRADDPVNEFLTGNFWMIFRAGYYGDRTYIPFVQGKIVTDQSQWKFEQKWGEVNSSREMLEKLILTTNNCTLSITVDLETAGSIRDWKVYIDGYVNFTGANDTPPENGDLIRISSGKHRIVLREFDHTKADRKESNTIYFEAKEGHTNSFHLVKQNGQFILLERG